MVTLGILGILGQRPKLCTLSSRIQCDDQKATKLDMYTNIFYCHLYKGFVINSHAIISCRRPHLEATVRLLLWRGANPNASSLPMPVLFFAVKAADTAAVEILLQKGADTSAKLSKEVRISIFCYYFVSGICF